MLLFSCLLASFLFPLSLSSKLKNILFHLEVLTVDSISIKKLNHERKYLFFILPSRKKKGKSNARGTNSSLFPFGSDSSRLSFLNPPPLVYLVFVFSLLLVLIPPYPTWLKAFTEIIFIFIVEFYCLRQKPSASTDIWKRQQQQCFTLLLVDGITKEPEHCHRNEC